MAQLSVTPRTAGDVTRLGLAGRITISVSHLHSLFAGRDTTVAARVRRRRLQRARRDLGDPALGAAPVHHIAARRGFHDHSTFTRAFRGAYGMTPREYRRGYTPR
ncbi:MULTISPECIES: helix-turn-helix domain-containing protein [Streptomyces]|uniref:Helix-turn-helix domain-containing protein n=1 Tax=Streptomyces fungicidicus TaxID=68203 RepID=A0ACC7Y625_9ACTN|nr:MULTISPECIES: helix-turn-helix domain-containing protein [Streptomyces]NUV77131.1 helix-turn-helix domain-containing protein [Streptomyces fungicidicus]PAX82926.1 hypothetical protein CLM81_25050 [Streptomyces albidoflavus]PAX92900.1 hypothetical protein CLM82_00525 [Streptomyces albidoflavus]PBO20417.1 hypothetical protein CLM83_00635 [Streptomyces albidoflavus]PBO23673.1 hypothetical protein CLM85_14735 [Streptomyces albidoflavus]